MPRHPIDLAAHRTARAAADVITRFEAIIETRDRWRIESSRWSSRDLGALVEEIHRLRQLKGEHP